MKVIEQSRDRVWVSSEASLWGKVFCWSLAVCTLSMLIWGETFGSHIFAVMGSLFWFALSTSVAETIFDIKRNTIFGKYRILGINLRNLEVPLKTSKLLSVIAKHNPNLYLVIASGKKYRIGDFWTISEHDSYMSGLLKHVPIDHDRNF